MTTKKRCLTAVYTGAIIGVLLELKDGNFRPLRIALYCGIYVAAFLLIEGIRWIVQKK